MTDQTLVLKLSSLSVLDLIGKDAEAILHNLTTNEIKSLKANGHGTETCITNVKGKCVGHGCVFRTDVGFRFIGAAGQSEAIASHADRYTIREDAVPTVVDGELDAWLVVANATSCEKTQPFGKIGGEESPPLSHHQWLCGSATVDAYSMPWCGAGRSWLFLTSSTDSVTADLIVESAKQSGLLDDAANVASIKDLEADSTFASLRVASGYPWYGVDFDDSHLPQEISREPETISFTKGCYLGQETVARLDALGQVQKKLVSWKIPDCGETTIPLINTKLFATPEATQEEAVTKEKPVGRLTSVVRDMDSTENVCRAIGFARRSHFDPDSRAYGRIDGHQFAATVVSPNSEEANRCE